MNITGLSKKDSIQYARDEKRASSILIVEDESIVAMDLSNQLKEMGYHVCAMADNGIDAIERAEQHKPDLVLMDIVIKGEMDGIETAKHIAHRYNIPVIFLTAYTDGGTVERAAKAAPYGYVSKPYLPKELRAAIEVGLYKAELENHLRESEHWFSTTLRCVGDAVIATDTEGKIKFINPAAEISLGLSLDEVMGLSVEDVMVLEDARTGMPVECPALRALRHNCPVGIEFGTLVVGKNGKKLPIDDSAAPIRDDSGDVLGAVVVFRDVTDRLVAEVSVRQSEERFHKAFSFAPVGMALVGMDGRFLQVNGAICSLLERDEVELLQMYQSDLTNPSDTVNERAKLNEVMTGQSATVEFEKRYQTRSQKNIWVLVSVSLLTQSDQPFCYLYQIHDLTQRKETESRLAQLAHFDALTGLANRTKLWEEADKQIMAAKRKSEQFAVIFIDLDHFKQVNDSLGHEVGDHLLQEVADRLQASVRETDCVARLGGDEFVLLLPNIQSEEDISAITNKIWAQFIKPVILADQKMTIGLSMGVSLFPEDGLDAKTLLRCADSALYHAKAEGRNNLQFYRPELTARLGQKLKLERELRNAIEQHEFELHYQPIVTMSGEVLHGAEALIRWHHPEDSLLLPDNFIRLAEETGLILSIGDWVMSEACKQAATWQKAGQCAVGISVNVSVRQFKAGGILQSVRNALTESGLMPSLLTIEITEQLMLQNTDQNLVTIRNLKDLGVQIAIDDFGIGYSSLNYIKRFSPHKLKIDRSFVRDLVTDPDDAAIVRAIIAMSRSLKMEVVAEGIETEAQRDFLQQEGCDFAQGFLYARPLSAEDFCAWVTTHNAQRVKI